MADVTGGPAEAGDAGGGDGDELPAHLDPTGYVGPYLFPDTGRRRVAAWSYVVVAGLCLAGGVATGNAGLLGAAALLLVVALIHRSAAFVHGVDQTEALVVASRAVGFPVGHASAQLAWRGLRSRPSWRILCYSADDPPSRRGLVELDAVDGRVLDERTEALTGPATADTPARGFNDGT